MLNTEQNTIETAAERAVAEAERADRRFARRPLCGAIIATIVVAMTLCAGAFLLGHLSQPTELESAAATRWWQLAE